MDMSFSLPATLSCATLVLAGLVPSGLAQGYQAVSQLEEGPRSFFDSETEDTLAKFLNWGALHARPHADLKAYYDSNLTLNDKDLPQEEDFVWRISPGILLGVGEFRGEKGNYVTLDYTMTGSIYTKYDDYNALDHNAEFRAGWKTAKFTAELLQSYVTENGKQIEAGSFVDQEVFLTGLATKYLISEKSFVELNGRQSLVDSEAIYRDAPNDDLTSVNEWVAEAWYNYKLSEKLTLGAGPTLGWRDIVPGANQTFQQGMLKAGYLASQKLAFNGAVGVHFSQFQDGEEIGPKFVMEFGGTWKAMENSQVSLNAYRRDQVALTDDYGNYFATGFSATYQHRFREKYLFTIQGGYENLDYYATVNVPGPDGDDRNDNYVWISPVAALQIDDRTMVGAFYQYRDRVSKGDDAGSDFDNHQFGLFAKYAF